MPQYYYYMYSSQALKFFFQMNRYLHKFTSLSVQHRLDLFEKLIIPNLNYGSQVWGFDHGTCIERFILNFVKDYYGLRNVPKLTLSMESLDV